MNEQEIFQATLERDPRERAAYLDEACGDEGEARRRIEHLLRMHERAGSFIEKPAAEIVEAVQNTSLSEGPGTQIGPYKLLQEIGEGGFGVVYMAEQRKPVRRKVALKIVKPGMDTRNVVARFEAERQALAMMDHPNIAKVLDAGTVGNSPRAAETTFVAKGTGGEGERGNAGELHHISGFQVRNSALRIRDGRTS